jgi:hypothetical protein
MREATMSPEVDGLPIEIIFAPALRAHRGKLLSGKSSPGEEVHAASLIRQRRIVLDAALRKKPAELERILIHELFHFAWVRLGNPGRRSFEELVGKELHERVRGELGWSAEHLKVALKRRDRAFRSRRWREYVCESFCDTAAWLLGRVRRHEEFTLPADARRRRGVWFRRTRLARRISV